eukprot:scaffold44473_cov66-Phaeocystis_antarctica.AAC.2
MDGDRQHRHAVGRRLAVAAAEQALACERASANLAAELELQQLQRGLAVLHRLLVRVCRLVRLPALALDLERAQQVAQGLLGLRAPAVVARQVVERGRLRTSPAAGTAWPASCSHPPPASHSGPPRPIPCRTLGRVACRAAAPSRTRGAPRRSYPRAGSLGPGPPAPVPSWGSRPPSLVAAATAASRSVGSEARLGAPLSWLSAARRSAPQSRACPNRRGPWMQTEPTPLRVPPAVNVRTVHANRRLGEVVAGRVERWQCAWNPRATMPFLNSFLEILPSLLVSHCGAEQQAQQGCCR